MEEIDIYLSQVQKLLGQLPGQDIQAVINVLRYARVNGRQVFIIGNGGSAATASHFACDLAKGTVRDGSPRFQVTALTDNMPLFSAWANDAGYEHAFSQQLVSLVEGGDIVIAISGSGNSPNVLNAVGAAKSLGAITIGLAGFSGGGLKDLADICVIVPSDCMEQVEDVHLVLEHLICTTLRRDQFEPRAALPMSMEHRGPMTGRRRAVFLDRDGVINQNRSDYVKSWDEFAFLPEVFDALRMLASSPLAIVIVTNQSAIGRNIVTQSGVEEINRRMVEQVQQRGGRIDGVYFCPHRPEDRCRCRKPAPGLLLDAAGLMGIDLAHSYVIGDSLDDLRAGRSVGCRGALVLTGRGLEELCGDHHSLQTNYYLARNIFAAARWVMEREAAVSEGRL
jgi:D-sedoheptulose 7-phosphate isomerase